MTYLKAIFQAMAISLFLALLVLTLTAGELNVFDDDAELAITVPVDIKTDIIDLRNFDFDKNYATHYYEKFYTGAYLYPGEDFEGFTPTENSSMQYLTQRTVFLLPNNNAVNISLYSVSSYALRVFANGKKLCEYGTLTQSPQGALMGAGKMIFTVTPVNNQIELITHSSNFFHEQSDFTANISVVRIGSPQLLGALENTISVQAVIITGALFSCFFLLTSLYLFNAKLTQNLYFALTCLVFALRGIYINRLDTVLLPSVPTYWLFIFQYIAMAGLLSLIILYFDKVFPNVLDKWGCYTIYAGSALYTILLVILPSAITTGWVKHFTFFIILSIVYFVIKIILKFRNPKLDQIISITGIAVFILLTILDMGYFRNWWLIPPPFKELLKYGMAAERGMLVFVISQMTSLFIGYGRMAAEAKESERTLSETNAMLERLNTIRTQFLSNISHEMKTPLTEMSVNAQISVKKLKHHGEGEHVIHNLEMISKEAAHLGSLVGSMLALGRLQENSHETEYVSLDEVVLKACQLYRHIIENNGNKLVVFAMDNIPKTMCNADLLSQVIINMLSNSNKHTKEGEISVSIVADISDIRITVRDSGAGIPEHILPRIFERYQKSGKDGMGIGLSLAKDIIDTHGGKIWVESTSSEGTAIVFTVPIKKGENNDENSSSC